MSRMAAMTTATLRKGGAAARDRATAAGIALLVTLRALAGGLTERRAVLLFMASMVCFVASAFTRGATLGLFVAGAAFLVAEWRLDG